MRVSTLALALSVQGALTIGVARADVFNITYEAPGIENTLLPVAGGGVETFNAEPTGFQTFTTGFGAITGTYTNVQVNSADQYGGSGGTGNYAAAFTTPYALTLSSGVNYFGFWLSAVDPFNTITFYDNATTVGSLTGAQVTAALSGNSAYFGNPDANFQNDDSGEVYAFINFVDETGTFNKIVFSETNSCCGFESDNDTIGMISTATRNVIPAPEPATGALLLVGLVGTAFAMRRRSVSNVSPIAAA
jgi:hypothetical protein